MPTETKLTAMSERSLSSNLSLTDDASERDEVKVVQEGAQKDTQIVNRWRLAATLVLLLTAVAVTVTTFHLLKKEETESFETAFEQFSRTIADAAIAQQVDLREGLDALSTTMSIYGEMSDEEWPFVTVPKYEHYASNMRKQAKTEIVSWLPIVSEENRVAYVEYANKNVQNWVEEGHMIQMGSLERLQDPVMASYHPYIAKVDPTTGGLVEDTGVISADVGQDFYLPLWQYSPPPVLYALMNLNANSVPWYKAGCAAAGALQYEAAGTPVIPYSTVPLAMTYEEHEEYHSHLQESSHLNPHTSFLRAIQRNASDLNSEVVGYLATGVAWDAALLGLLPSNVVGLQAVVSNTCNQSYTYEIRGEDAIFIGEGELHDRTYEDMSVEVDLALHTHPNFTTTPGHCMYSLNIYPTKKFKSLYDSNTPEVFAGVVAVTFVLVAIVFFVYDIFVQKRNTNLIVTAAKSSAIVTDLIPAHLRNRLEQDKAARPKGNLTSFLSGDKEADGSTADKPLADLFLETTVLYASISGFTAWSSVREPSQVFTLLEKTYQAFDEIAKSHRVYKVETVGDCYVCATGIPNPRPDHAVLMAKFARAIVKKMDIHVKIMEKTLGPDTAELSLRVGMHSGPVTAGVLRGERARFQLFGDTMNVCHECVRSGLPGRIQCSKETADLLRESGKAGWLDKRTGQVAIAGIGTRETYWVSTGRDHMESTQSMQSIDELTAMATIGHGTYLPGLDERTKRLIDWNVEMLLGMIRQIIAHRGDPRKLPSLQSSSRHMSLKSSSRHAPRVKQAQRPLDEVREIIHLPEFDVKSSRKRIDPGQVVVPDDVVEQLHHLVSKIASLYNDNPFHNFDHASHVVMSVTKLMSRIVAPKHLEGMNDVAKDAHDHTYGITSDPLTQFACAFSALIHDVDHVGVSNAQLVKEGVPIASKYGGRSVAEQNSLDLSWDLLMEPRYQKLVDYLFPNESILTRFRQLVVNSVMSTDIVDKDLKALRNARWDKAFKEGVSANRMEENPRDKVNRKATIVIEHIIQASDISHTMQHWHVYRKWNQNLFEELYVAYLNGRMEKNPADFWYKGEFGFFDFYIIPLTQKLKDCGVFGVSSDEYLNYAKKNREEWEAMGEEVVQEMIEKCHEKYGMKAGRNKVEGLKVETNRVDC